METLRPTVLFATAISLVFALAPSSPALAGNSSVELGAISVTASPREGAGLSFERVGRREIEDSTEESAAGVLSRLPSVQALDNARGESIIQLRGFDQQQILVLIDGAPSAIPFDGVLDLGKLPAAMIERIEVVKGSGSVVYGPGGLGGAINIITRTPRDAPLLEFSSGGSPVHEIDGSILHGGSIGSFRYSIFGGFDVRKDFPISASFSPGPNQGKGDRAGSNQTYGYGGGTLEVDVNESHALLLSGNVVGGRYGVPPSAVSPRPKYWRFDPWIAATAQLSHEGRYLKDKLEISETVFVSPFGNTLRSYDDADYDTQTKRSSFTSRYDDLAAGGFVRARFSLEPGFIDELNFRLWGGGRYEKHAESSAGTPGETQYSHWLLTLAPQVDAKISGMWSATAGAQIDAEVPDRFAGIVEPKNQITAGPFVAVGFSPSKSFDIALSAARRARFPTLKERFADAFGQRVTNPSLGAERSWNFSLDATARLPLGFKLKASVFDSELSGAIVRV
ncbi:MAG TPA: TonB-dependent receptor plug domain-containing protein, partial [bacterium]|nr:TonB-dependent receptor plug domain-containing protein [bacterium]